MSTVRVSAEDLPGVLAQHVKGSEAAVVRGMKNGSFRGLSILVKRTPVHQGQLRASWRVSFKQVGGNRIPEIENTAPYAGVIELGARPHPMPREAIDALARWAHLKLGLRGKDAEGAAWAIAQKIKREGQKPTYFIRDSLPEVGKAMADSVQRAIKRFANHPPRRP